MADRRKTETAWLFFKASAFTLLVPMALVVLGPYFLLEDASLAAIYIFGMSLLGMLPIVLGTALYCRCAYCFVRLGRGTPAPIDPPVRLVIEGPYGYSRNPMYIAVLSILVGEALLYRSPSLLTFVLALAAGFHLVIVGYEERVLRRQFGQAYAGYRGEVPRWIPKRSGLKWLYTKSFLKVGALVLVGGMVAHMLRLTVGLPVLQTPVSLHSFLVVLPAYTVFGCIVYWRQIDLAGIPRKITLALIILLLLTTVVMHAYSIAADDNSWYRIFPMWYSALAVIVYGGFAYFLKTRTLVGG